MSWTEGEKRKYVIVDRFVRASVYARLSDPVSGFLECIKWLLRFLLATNNLILTSLLNCCKIA